MQVKVERSVTRIMLKIIKLLVVTTIVCGFSPLVRCQGSVVRPLISGVHSGNQGHGLVAETILPARFRPKKEYNDQELLLVKEKVKDAPLRQKTEDL
jgi:hypothetical protein